MISKFNYSYRLTGTTSPIYIPRKEESNLILAGKDYFIIQILGGQAAFRGSIWQRVKNLVIATQVNLNHPMLGQGGMRAIQRTREVQPNRVEQLGLRPDLVKMVPAVMTNVSLSIDFILDKENTLRDLSGLINSDCFLATISLAPGMAMVARTISSLATKVIETFVPSKDREPILEFTGDFNIAPTGLAADDGEYLRDGYYVILGTRDEKNPLPSGKFKLQVSDGFVLINGEQVTQLSYIVLAVFRTPVRTRDLNEGAVWDLKLREAESVAQSVGDDPKSKVTDHKNAWERCRNLLKEAQALLQSDPNYHRHEAEKILAYSYNNCIKKLSIETGVKKSPIVPAGRKVWQPDLSIERQIFGFQPNENLDALEREYDGQILEAKRILGQLGM